MYNYQQDEESNLSASCDSFTCHENTTEQDLLHEKEIRVINYDRYCERQLNFGNSKKEVLNLEKSLSKTLNQLTKNKSSVELILEVEMVNSDYLKKIHNKKSNSLIEVTVIHTNNSDNLKNEKIERKTFPVREIKHSESETGSMKRRKWFDRIINNRLQKSESKGKHDKHNRNAAPDNHFHNIAHKLQEQSEKKQILITKNHSNNNEDGGHAEHEMYHNGISLTNLLKHKREIRKKPTSYRKIRKHTDLEKKQSFSKNDEIQKIEKALDTLKNKINSKIDIQNKHSPKARGYVYNLGKVVNNILTDIIEKPESNSKEHDNVIVDSYFQAIISQSKLINNKNKNTNTNKIIDDVFKKRNPTLTKNLQSKTDRNVISLYTKKNGFSGPSNVTNVDMKMASTCGTNNTLIINKDLKCTELSKEGSQKDAHVQVESLHISDVDKNKLMDSKCFKMVNSQFTSKEHVQKFCDKSKFTVRGNISHHHLGSRKKCYRKTKKKLNKCGNIRNTSHEYLWMWDGKKFGICFDLKKRIETLIIKELQNLALKESFEYSISQINDNLKLKEPSTSITFLCHLDINDKKIKHISRTINGYCSDYNPTHGDIKLNPSDKRNIFSKCEYKEFTISQHNSYTLNTAICKDFSTESIATKEHTHIVPKVQHMHTSSSKVITDIKTGDTVLPEATNTTSTTGTYFSHFNKNVDYNIAQLSELPVNKTKYPLPDIQSTCPSKHNHIMDTKQCTYKHYAEQLENIEIKYFNVNWTPESEDTSNHFIDKYTKEEKLSNLAENENEAESNFSKQNQAAEVKENKMKKKKIRKVKAEPKSDESLWNGIKTFVQNNTNFDKIFQKQIQQKTINTCSEGTHNTQSTVEIEIDLKNFKSILEKTKRKNKYKTEQGSENKSRNHKRIPLVKNDDYTKSLLIETGKKLEEYIKGKEYQKIKKRKTEI